MMKCYPGIERSQALAPMWAKLKNVVVDGKKPSGNTVDGIIALVSNSETDKPMETESGWVNWEGRRGRGRGWFENNNLGSKMVVVAKKETGFLLLFHLDAVIKISKNELWGLYDSRTVLKMTEYFKTVAIQMRSMCSILGSCGSLWTFLVLSLLGCCWAVAGLDWNTVYPA